MSVGAIKAAVSSAATISATPSVAPGAAGKMLPHAGKRTPAQLSNQAHSIARLNLDAVVQRLNISSKSIGRSLRFQVDLHRGQPIILVLDRDTGELIRRIPPQKAQFTLSKINGAFELPLFDALV